jgi:hypothetical protein
MKAKLHEHHNKIIMNVHKTKLTLMTAIAAVILTGAAVTAKAEAYPPVRFVAHARIGLPVPPLFAPRMIVPAPPVVVAPVCAPVVVAPAPVVVGGFYRGPVIVRRPYYGYRRW